MEGKLHIYHSKRRLILFEYASASSPSNNNILLFVGGMFDNFRGTGYVDELATALQNSAWRVCHVQLSSATRSFGTMSLARDVEEIDACIKFIRSSKIGKSDTKVVLMGHSTGCQDVLTYIYSSGSRSPIQGAILQAAVSDRDAAMNSVNTNPETKKLYDQAMEIVSSTPKEQYKTTIIPMHLTTPIFGPVPMSITRFLSLVSPGSPENPGPDDLFSNDLPSSQLSKTFGRVGADTSPLQPLSTQQRSLMILNSGSDEAVPSHVDKAALVERWKTEIEAGGAELHPQSHVIPNAIHDVSGETDEQKHARQVVLRKAVVAYLDDVLGKETIQQGVAAMKL
jgi:hypothetical protein